MWRQMTLARRTVMAKRSAAERCFAAADQVRFTAQWLQAAAPQDRKRYEGRIGAVTGYRMGATDPIVHFQRDGRRVERRLFEVRSAYLERVAPADASVHEERSCVMVFDVDLCAPACVLLQAAHGCGSHPRAMALFEPRHWLTVPTPGMRKISGTHAQWEEAAAKTRARWKDAAPLSPP
jgi:hypothetical protein